MKKTFNNNLVQIKSMSTLQATEKEVDAIREDARQKILTVKLRNLREGAKSLNDKDFLALANSVVSSAKAFQQRKGKK